VIIGNNRIRMLSDKHIVIIAWEDRERAYEKHHSRPARNQNISGSIQMAVKFPSKQKKSERTEPSPENIWTDEDRDNHMSPNTIIPAVAEDNTAFQTESK
jgi:hypothetical protein